MDELKLRDVARGVVRHLAASFRRRFVRADAPVSSLADEIDFATFCRQIGEPNSSDVEKFLATSPDAAWPDPFLDLDDFPNEIREC